MVLLLLILLFLLMVFLLLFFFLLLILLLLLLLLVVLFPHLIFFTVFFTPFHLHDVLTHDLHWERVTTVLRQEYRYIRACLGGFGSAVATIIRGLDLLAGCPSSFEWLRLRSPM